MRSQKNWNILFIVIVIVNWELYVQFFDQSLWHMRICLAIWQYAKTTAEIRKNHEILRAKNHGYHYSVQMFNVHRPKCTQQLCRNVEKCTFEQVEISLEALYTPC